MSKSWSDLDDVSDPVYEPHNNLLIIDGNNLAYRYIRRANFDSYQDDYIRTVESLGRSYKAKHTYVCFDFGKSNYRLAMHEMYKGTRKKAETEEEIAHFDAFFKVLNSLPEYLEGQSLKFRGVEADDLITYLVLNRKEEYEHVWITSSDKDVLQLLDTNVSVFNLFSRKEITVDSLFEKTGLTPLEYRLARMMEGETGDNIEGIEGVGEKRSQAIAKEYKSLDNLLASLPLKGTSKYIANINKAKDLLVTNNKLVNLIDFNDEALAASFETDIFERLEDV